VHLEVPKLDSNERDDDDDDDNDPTSDLCKFTRCQHYQNTTCSLVWCLY
jgi:hypothetical protein